MDKYSNSGNGDSLLNADAMNSKHHRLLVPVFFLILLLIHGDSLAQPVSVNIPAKKDNTLYEDPAGALSNGAGYYLFAGRTSQLTNSIRRGLMAFDVASMIPPGSVIVDARLTLFMSKASALATANTIELHRLQSDWGEGTSDALGEEGGGAPAATGDATWIHTFFNTGFWTSPGGDLVAGISSSASVNLVGFYTFMSTTNMVADVQNWLDNPADNFGWIILGDETAPGTSRRFNCKEDTLSTNRPILTLSYNPPTCCIGIRGDVNHDGLDANILDLTYLVDRIFRGGPPAFCAVEADLNSDGTPSNIIDLTFLVDRIFRGGPPSGPC